MKLLRFVASVGALLLYAAPAYAQGTPDFSKVQIRAKLLSLAKTVIGSPRGN